MVMTWVASKLVTYLMDFTVCHSIPSVNGTQQTLAWKWMVSEIISNYIVNVVDHADIMKLNTCPSDQSGWQTPLNADSKNGSMQIFIYQWLEYTSLRALFEWDNLYSFGINFYLFLKTHYRESSKLSTPDRNEWRKRRRTSRDFLCQVSASHYIIYLQDRERGRHITTNQTIILSGLFSG